MPTIQLPRDSQVDVKLKVLIRHLVLSFPHTTILSRQVEDRYHVFIISPFDGGPDKVIQVERAVLAERYPSVDEFRVLLESLHLPFVLESCDRYDLRQASQTHQGWTRSLVSEGKAQHTGARAPAVGEWRPSFEGGTVGHGHFNLSGPSLPSPTGTVSRLLSQ